MLAAMNGPAHCREFARKCREMARTAHGSTATTLLDLANSYDDLAGEMERAQARPEPRAT